MCAFCWRWKLGVGRLFSLKIHSPEVKPIPKIEILHKYPDASIAEMNRVIEMLSENS